MSVYTTDHPLASRISCFDKKLRPWRSFFFSVLIEGLVLTPLLYGFALCQSVHDASIEGSETGGWPDTWGDFIYGAAICFVFCLTCAFVIALVHRLVVRQLHQGRYGVWTLCGIGFGFCAAIIWWLTFDPLDEFDLSPALFPLNAPILGQILTTQENPYPVWYPVWYCVAFIQWGVVGAVVDLLDRTFKRVRI
jgi:hypothetical protein